MRRFKPREIEAATSGFSTALETGGPRGTTYRARFADGLVATVRRVAGGDRDHDHEEQDGAFYRELQLLGRLNHRHVVRLRGFSEGHNRLIRAICSCSSLFLVLFVCDMVMLAVPGFWCLIRWRTGASRNAYMVMPNSSQKFSPLLFFS